MSSSEVSKQHTFEPSLDELVRPDHPYRVLLKLVPFGELCAPMRAKYSRGGRPGYPVETMFKALLLQWMDDLSDRELERFLEENLAGKLFCGFGLRDRTPDHSSFGVMRERIGLTIVADLFNSVRAILASRGLVKEIFTFVDATQLISKLDLWRERDEAIASGQGRLNNLNVSKLAADQDARFGRKGSTKWFGYKLHAAIDMGQGFITRIAATPANCEDAPSVRHVLPRQGMIFGDKAYSVGEAKFEIQRRGLHNGAIKRRNAIGKDFDKDRFLRWVRMPYEGAFAHFEKHARYRGLYKTQYQAFMQGLAHNFKRLIVLDRILRPQCA